MSSAPLSKVVLAEFTPKNIREIDHEYHVEMIAENSKELVEYHKALLRVQAESAALNLAGQQEIARRQDEANRYLRGIEEDCRAMVEGIDRLNDTVGKDFAGMNDALSEGFGAVVEGLEVISQQMMKQQRILKDIAEVLRRPYEVKALELRKEAEKWLTGGMTTTGHDRDENWMDATRLLQAVIENPIGMQDYAVWFQTGWLLWKHKKNFPDAEKAF